MLQMNKFLIYNSIKALIANKYMPCDYEYMIQTIARNLGV